jgi:predicted CoA-substrate-specific enzyme activase
MSYFVGIDVGAVSAAAALVTRLSGDEAPDQLGGDFARLDADAGDLAIYLSPYHRTRGKPVAAATELLEQIIAAVGADRIAGVCLTGSGSQLVAERLDAAQVNEFKAVASGLATLRSPARTVFEMGGETSKYLQLSVNEDGSRGITDYATNGDCAAGTGSFLDQQAGRLRYAVEQVAPAVLASERSAQIAGRCSVFAKSDMIHAQQKGYTPQEVLAGLCDAVARNFRSAVVRSHAVVAPVVFIGGVAANEAVAGALARAFDLGEDEFLIPKGFAHIPAIGAASEALRSAKPADLSRMSDLRAASDTAHGVFPTAAPLSMDRVVLLRDRAETHHPSGDGEPIDAYLGLDVGSVSTNVVAIDTEGRVVTEIYTRTMGRPIEVVTDALREIEDEWGDRIVIRGVGTTGSGRELIGQLVGADTVNDEITAHKTGSTFVGQTLLAGRKPDTIFEIGGQDSKYISLQDGVVVDFTMNDACAAGTGSFLEERAEELDIAIKDEFASLALSSDAPIRLGERCTVFMERDVNSYMQRGAEKKDLVAGLAYSVVFNYINRVVRGRKIGDCIFFQGGTAYNDAVAAAFAAVTGKEIIVPPFNGVIGAIGAALLARDKMTASDEAEAPQATADAPSEELGAYVSDADPAAGDSSYPVDSQEQVFSAPPSRFRGYDLSQVDYTLREFTCKGCSNACQIQEFNVEGEKTYWGDKCSDRYRKRAKATRQPVVEDLFALREQLLTDESSLPQVPADAPLVGIPRAMFALEWLPFWRTFLAYCGWRTVLSEPTNRRIVQAGEETVVAEPCFPIIVAHGHLVSLIEKGVDYLFVPNILSMETRWMHTESHLCPWHQTLPFVTRRAPRIEPHADKFLTPQIHFREGRDSAIRELRKYFATKGIRPKAIDRAADAAFAAQDRFSARLLREGRKALSALDESGQPGIVVVGRPYNVHDAGVNLSVGPKLRDTYGVNCIPLDFLDLDAEDIRGVNPRMYWNLGRRVLAAARIVGRHDNLHIIFITNFKCGPDSFIKHFIQTASGEPFLTLQFDGHSNDAGMMTRCEAYLDSKGLLRPWRKDRALVTQPA